MSVMTEILNWNFHFPLCTFAISCRNESFLPFIYRKFVNRHGISYQADDSWADSFKEKRDKDISGCEITSRSILINISNVVFQHQLQEQVWSLSPSLFANAQHLHGGGAGVLMSPTVPLRAASSDGHQMGLDVELIWAAITASGEGANWWRWEDATATIVHNQVNVSNCISCTDGHTQLSLTPPVPLTTLKSHSLCSGRCLQSLVLLIPYRGMTLKCTFSVSKWGINKVSSCLISSYLILSYLCKYAN